MAFTENAKILEYLLNRIVSFFFVFKLKKRIKNPNT